MMIPPALFNTATIGDWRITRHLPTIDQLLDLRNYTASKKLLSTYPPDWFDNEIAAIDLLLKLRLHRDQQTTRPHSTTHS